MLTYKTIDSIPDLTASDMAQATVLRFAPESTGRISEWDFTASTMLSQSYRDPTSVFSVSLTASATYFFFTMSQYDPFYLRVYDASGNAVATQGPQALNPTYDSIHNFVAPYTGTYYVAPGWNPGSISSYVHLSVNENIDTIPRANTMFNGGNGNDTFSATRAGEFINAGGGFDTVTYANARSDYNIVANGATVTVKTKGSVGDLDALIGVEKIQFADKALNLEYNDLTQALYIGYFGRAADPKALENFQAQLAALKAPTNFADFSARYATDASIRNLIDSFGTSAESKALYTGDTKSFVNAVFGHILERAPKADGLDFWVNAIDSGSLTRANASLSIMAGALANTTSQGQLDGTLIANKISVASNFTFGLDTAAKAASYSGAAAAGLVRGLLVLVDATTDITAFQQTVNTVLTSLTGTLITPAAPESTYAQIELIGTGAADLPPAYY